MVAAAFSRIATRQSSTATSAAVAPFSTTIRAANINPATWLIVSSDSSRLLNFLPFRYALHRSNVCVIVLSMETQHVTRKFSPLSSLDLLDFDASELEDAVESLRSGSVQLSKYGSVATFSVATIKAELTRRFLNCVRAAQ